MSKAQTHLDKVRDVSKLRQGNTEGVGRTPNYLRKEHQDVHGKLMDRLVKKVDADQEVPSYLLKALEVTGKYGMGEVKAVSLDDSETIRTMNLATAAYFQGIGQPELYDGWLEAVRAAAKDV